MGRSHAANILWIVRSLDVVLAREVGAKTSNSRASKASSCSCLGWSSPPPNPYGVHPCHTWVQSRWTATTGGLGPTRSQSAID